MYNTYDNLSVERVRRRRRNNRRRKERIRRIKIICLLSVAVLIALALVIWVVGDGCSDDNKPNAGANATVNSVNGTDNGDDNTNIDDATNTGDAATEPSTEEDTEETTPEETTTKDRYADYGDELYTDGKFVVCIDAGHGSNDAGSIGVDGIYEKDDTLMLAKYLKNQLESMGVTVIMTRTTDVWVDLADRPKFANDNNADLLVSLHRNSYPADTSVKGYEAWINSFGSDNAYDVASKIMANLEAAGISRNRGVRLGTMDGDKDYKVNSGSSMPSVLLEMGFMSSSIDNNQYRQNAAAYATAIANAIVQWSQNQPY